MAGTGAGIGIVGLVGTVVGCWTPWTVLLKLVFAGCNGDVDMCRIHWW
jgi:hypothetical protein